MADQTSGGGALNVKIDMADVRAVLDQQSRLHVTLPTPKGDLTLLEATRTARAVGGAELADNQVNVLC